MRRRPNRLIRNGRGSDGAFSAWHLLYRRFNDEDFDGDRLLPARIKYQDLSVNWSKYSRPWDVVFDYPGDGIASISVGEVRKDLPTNLVAGAKVHAYFPVHDPEELNYSHTELAVFKEGKRLVRDAKLPDTVKKEFRAILSNRSVILVKPTCTGT